MANKQQLEILKEGVGIWNNWRIVNPEEKINLSNADLSKSSLTGVDFSWANLSGSNLSEAIIDDANLIHADLFEANLIKANLCDTHLTQASLFNANLCEANLVNASFHGTNFDKANLTGANLNRAWLGHANLHEANLTNASLIQASLLWANLTKTNLYNADLTGAKLQSALLVETNIEQTTLTNCSIFGISVWSVSGTPKEQSSLIITPDNEPLITVDDLQVAQFVYLILNRENLRNVLNTISSKTVLILGRFTPERKLILHAIAEELRKNNFLPIIFDFDRPIDRDLTETIKILAGMSLFVIADITNPASSPLELQATVPDYQVPFVPIIQEGEKPFSMFTDLIGKYDWVLQPLEYSSCDILRVVFKDLIIDRAVEKHKQIQMRKATHFQTLSTNEYLKQKGLTF